jgi:hypothetical protein
VRTCEHCGRSIEHKRRDARHCDGPCRAAASRTRAAERANNAARASEPSLRDKSAQKRTQPATNAATWTIATVAEEALADRLRREYPEISGAT